MQIASTTTNVTLASKSADVGVATQTTLISSLSQYQIIRRNGAVVPFEPAKIAVAMMKAFLAVHGTQGAASASVRETVDQLTQTVSRALMRSRRCPTRSWGQKKRRRRRDSNPRYRCRYT